MIDMIEAPEAQTDISTLPPADRAALVLNSTKTEADLKQLATSLKAITLVNSPAGREQAHSLAMTARTARTTIEKLGKAARDDATKFSKAVIAEEDRLIEIIQPEETRVLGLRNAWDAAEAERKEAELQKERDRIAAHQAVIAQIRSYPGLARECRTSAMALQMLEKLWSIDINGLEEFQDAAREARISADEQINDIIEAKQAAEAEAARIKAEQEAENARLAAERERLEAERAEAARVQAEQQAELLAQLARMKAQQEELDRQAAAMAQQAAELEARKAEAEKPAQVLAEDSREALGQIMPEGLAIAAHQPEPVIVQVPATVEQMHAIGEGIRNDPEPVTTPTSTPPAMALIKTIAFEYGVEIAHATRWFAERADEFKTLAESQK
jgi:DNA repair exonuclease SbcCD ATPase subunit